MFQCTFREFISPLSEGQFFGTVYQKQFAHLGGDGAGVCEMLTWSDLNSLLAYHQTRFRQVRLVKEGDEIDKSRFVRWRTTESGPFQCVDIDDLLDSMRHGATLVINYLEEMCAPIRGLVCMVEKALSVRVHANLYAAFHSTPGLNTHWDTHAVFVLALVGRKRWRIFRPTVAFPSRLAKENESPKGDPIWEGILNPGEILYIPRGWWHDATPIGDAVMHVTLGMGSNTGIEFANWFINKLPNLEIMRRDLPRFATVADQEQHMQLMRQSLDAALQNVSIAEYFSDIDATAPRVNDCPTFPWAVSSGSTEFPGTAWAHWLAPRTVRFTIVNKEVQFQVFGREVTCPQESLCVLERLQTIERVRIADLMAINPVLTPSDLGSLLRSLAWNGVITVTDTAII
jgi:hypothetical protein